MKKILIGIPSLIILFLLVINIFKSDDAPIKVHNEQLTKNFLSKNIPIIDIRTNKEWERTGVLKNSTQITFYEEDGRFNEKSFLNSLNTKVNKQSEFAILCRSGNRSNRVTRFLISKGYKNVINLAGGIKQGIKNGVHFYKYNLQKTKKLILLESN